MCPPKPVQICLLGRKQGQYLKQDYDFSRLVNKTWASADARVVFLDNSDRIPAAGLNRLVATTEAKPNPDLESTRPLLGYDVQRVSVRL
jgi:hypothetical protein